MTNRTLKIVKQYIVGLCCIVFFFLLENSNIIPYFLEKTSKLRNNGFVTFIMTGFIILWNNCNCNFEFSINQRKTLTI